MASTQRRAVLGILMLEGRMAEVPGCLGSPASFPYPVVHRVVSGSRPPSSAAEAEALFPLYLEAARELEREGVSVLTENCHGLMALVHPRLAAALSVPFVGSALTLVPELHRMMPSRRIGILAFHPEAVDDQVCAACGFSPRQIPVVVAGVAGSAAWQEFLCTKEIPDALRPLLEADLVAAARGLAAAYPDLGAFVCECTLLPPASQAVRDALGLPVFDVLTLLDLAMRGRCRPPDPLSAC
jgi:hypothetical protein